MTESQQQIVPEQGPTPPGTPTWVKAIGFALALIVVLVLVKAVFGGGLAGHGPGMHGG